MTGFTNVVLAMDLSLSSPGFAVLALTPEGEPIVLEVSHVKTNAKTPHGARLSEIAYEIARLLALYQPEHIVREKGFSRFAATTQALFKVVGMADYITYSNAELSAEEISPTSVKKAVTGDGKASKQDVEKAVRRILRIDKPDYFANDDQSDAAAVGLAYLKSKGLISY